jgi:hypothetical protein
MSSLQKLDKARLLLHQHLSIHLIILNFEPKLARLHAILRDNVQLYIRYNNYGEYSYTIIFSKASLDRCRFDNYDDRWEVSTRPHHFHPRKEKKAIQSIMTGIPEEDMPYLCESILSNRLYNIDKS